MSPQIETDQHFPNKTNVEFVEIVSPSHIKLRVWERGSGETLACGTGMISSAAIANHVGKVNYPLTVEVPGGSAQIWLDEDGYSWMRGPAAIVYEGEFSVNNLLQQEV